MINFKRQISSACAMITISLTVVAQEYDHLSPLSPPKLPKEMTQRQQEAPEWFEQEFGSFQQMRYYKSRERLNHDITAFKKAKWSLISGDLKSARRFLRRLDNHSSPLSISMQRMQALIYFLDENFQEAQQILGGHHFSFVHSFTHFKETCSLQVLLALIQTPQEHQQTQRMHQRCQQALSAYSTNSGLWIDHLVKISSGQLSEIIGSEISDIGPLTESLELMRIFFKTALFSQNTSLLIPQLEMIPAEFYQYLFFREIIAFHYLRSGEYQKAYDFVEGIDSLNSDLIRAHLSLRRQQYEIAYGHFQLAKKRAPYSQDILSPLLALSWQLTQWREAREHLYSLMDYTYQDVEFQVMDMAFLLKKGKYQQALEIYNRLSVNNNGELSKVISMMGAHLVIVEQDLFRTQAIIEKACQNGHELYCWMAHQTLIWPNFVRSLHRHDHETLSDLTLSQLKDMPPAVRLQENLYINQRDIEELDTQETRHLFHW